jgi:hypothetical protein
VRGPFSAPKPPFDRSSDAAAQKLKAVIQPGMPDFSASMAAVRTKLPSSSDGSMPGRNKVCVLRLRDQEMNEHRAVQSGLLTET